MKVQELVAILQRIENSYGSDIEVAICDADTGWNLDLSKVKVIVDTPEDPLYIQKSYHDGCRKVSQLVIIS